MQKIGEKLYPTAKEADASTNPESESTNQEEKSDEPKKEDKTEEK